MNKIKLTGIIKNIQYSHNIKDIEYNKANLIIKRDNKEDIITLKFKKFSNPYNENDLISIEGNIRTFSTSLNGKNTVEVYVFTYFDSIDADIINECLVQGRICKKSAIRTTKNGKHIIDFIIANNIEADGKLLNIYIPCVAWGKTAKELDKLEVGTLLNVEGRLQSREYKKMISDYDFEIRMCHELNVINFNIEE